jgi:glucoside 3-dehydrogenase (cytochrome c) hitch-hiker subunit
VGILWSAAMATPEFGCKTSGPTPQSSSAFLSRRDLIRTILLAGASSLLAPGFAFAQAASELTPAQRGVDDSKLLADPNWKPLFLSDQQNETLIVLSDVIIPATDTPGAKEAQVNRYLDLILSTEPAELQQKFIASLTYIDSQSQRLFGKEFRALPAEDQSELLQPWSYPEQGFWGTGVSEGSDSGEQHFARLKQLIAGAYYSSEIGEHELGWDGSFTHGPFEGCQHPATTHAQIGHAAAVHGPVKHSTAAHK